MKETFVVLILVIGIGLFIAHKKNWIEPHTFQVLGTIFGILGGLVAIFVFIIPPAVPSSDENKNGPVSKKDTKDSNSSKFARPKGAKTENTNSYSEIVRSHNLILAGPKAKNEDKEATIRVSAGQSGWVFGDELIISVQSISNERKVTAVIEAPGFRNLSINKKSVGFRATYVPQKVYSIRITGVDSINQTATFLIVY